MNSVLARYNPNTRIIDLTVFQLVELIESVAADSRRKERPGSHVDENGKWYVYGLCGIADLLHCHRGTVCRLKKAGVLDEAIYQCGHLIVADAEKVLECVRKYNESQKQNKSKK